MREKLKSADKANVTQHELQKIFELGEFDPSIAYTALAKIIITSVFF